LGLSLVTAATAEPVSLAEAKAHLRVSGSDEDGLIAGYLLAARSYAQTYTRRVFSQQTWDQTFDYDWPRDEWGRPRLVLALQPVVSVTTLSYVPDGGGSVTLTANTDYIARTGDDQSGVIEPAYDVTWDGVRRQLNAVSVRFVAGYTRLPEEVRQAILMTVANFYEHRESTVVGTTAAELPLGASILLDPYRIR